MGGLLNRSPDQIDGRKMKGKKDKRKVRHQQFDGSYASDIYFMRDGHENEDIDADTVSSYEVWENNFDRQQITNMNGKILNKDKTNNTFSLYQTHLVHQALIHIIILFIITM